MIGKWGTIWSFKDDWYDVWWKSRQKITLAKKLVFWDSKNHDKNASGSVQTCFCVLQTENQTHAYMIYKNKY